MINYSSKVAGSINQRTKRSNKALLLIAGIESDSIAYSTLLSSMDSEFIDDLPNLLTSLQIKDLKKKCQDDRSHWMKDECNHSYNLSTLNLLNKLFVQGEIKYNQKFFLGCTFIKCYDWWFQSDEELRIAKENFRDDPRHNIPALKDIEEVYRSCHTAEEDLYDVLRSESKNISRYCSQHGWPIISVEWIISQLKKLEGMVLSNQTPASEWDFEQQLVTQFRYVRNLHPAQRMLYAEISPKPENYMMSTRGNNYNDCRWLREKLERMGWNSPIPTSMGSLFWYESKLYPRFRGSEGQSKIDKENFDYYNYGTGKKNGGSFRIFYYTSPQNNMFGNVASKIIIRGQEKNEYCAYRDQERGQRPLFSAIDGAGIDSSEYSDHQTITLLTWILKLYGFGEYAIPLAKTLQLPVKVGEDFIQPPNGSLAGGRLDVSLINDAGLIITWLIGIYIKQHFKAYICGDDWTYYFNSPIKLKDFKIMHSICTCFNQIVNSDKTEWLKRDSFLGFCKILVKEKEGELIPASGLPVNLWFKEPSSIRDIAQIAQSLSKTHQLDFLYPDEEDQQTMLIDLALFWEEEITEAEKIFKSPGKFKDRLESSLHIPIEYGGLLLDPDHVDFEILLTGVINGVNHIMDEYKRLPVKIASFIQSANIKGKFADYLSKEMVSGVELLISLLQDVNTVVSQWDRDKIYDLNLLRRILRQSQDLAQDYMSNSDGKSRKSTKDRTTPERDGDCFLDGYNPENIRDFRGIEKKIGLNDLVLLDCISSNPDLTDMQKLLAFRNVRFNLERFHKAGLIESYEGHGYQAYEYYYCIRYFDGRRIRISPVVNDSETSNGSFIPAKDIPESDLRTFVYQCRQILKESDLGKNLLLTDKILFSRLIEKVLRKKKEANRIARIQGRDLPYSKQAIEDEKEAMASWIEEMGG